MTEDQKEFENLPAESPAHVPMASSLFFNAAKFELAQRVAKVFASSDMVPAQFQGNIGNCVIALNLADRMGTDPFMLMQNIYIVHGKPGIEAKLAIALVNSTGKFSPLQYEYNSEKTSCHAWAIMRKTGEVCHGVTVSLEMAAAEGWMSKPGSKWKTMPELMLMYRSAMFFAKAYCPEALLGMQTKEELYDVDAVDMVSTGNGNYAAEETTEELAAKILDPKITPEKFPTVDTPDDKPDPDFDWFHTNHWMKKKSTGFTAFCIDNAERVDDIPSGAVCVYKGRSMRVIDAMRDKWHAVNPNKPFPGDEPNKIKTDVVYDPRENGENGSNEVRTARMENQRLKVEFPKEWESARSELGFGAIAATEEAAEKWNQLISRKVDLATSD